MSSEKKQGFASLSEDKRREISSQAGKAKNPNKGFGSLSPKERSKNASEASKIRWAQVKKLRKERYEQQETNNPTEDKPTENGQG